MNKKFDDKRNINIKADCMVQYMMHQTEKNLINFKILQ